MMKIYFAHPVSDYQRPRQTEAIALITAAGHKVENPDQPWHEEGYALHGMSYFTSLVETCDGLAFLRFPDGSIGAGVAKEIERALQRQMPIWDVTNGKLAPNGKFMPGPILSVEATRAMVQQELDRECPDCGHLDCQVNH